MSILFRALLPAMLLMSPALASPSPVVDPVPRYDLPYQKPLVRFVQYDSNPCTDGRYSDGKPRSCREILRMLERRDRYRERRERYDPCTDGRISDGRPRSCREIRRWLREDEDEEEWRPHKDWK